MTPEEFRAAGHQLVDWIADFRSSLPTRPVRAQVVPGQVREAFASSPPGATMTIDGLIGELDRIVVPGMTHVQHPRYFGWFPANASLASVLGDLASSGLGGLGISWESCPALTEVEEVVCDWMRQLVGLSPAWHGSIHDSASTSGLVALLVARERATALIQNRGGLQAAPAPLVVYTTHHAHSSVVKAALLAGYGYDNVRSVAVDASHAMDPDALAEAMDTDVTAGRRPAVVVATVGTTGTTAMDPLGPIVAVAARHDVWVHVDAAMAGSAMLLPECRHLWDGVEGADSITWNPHKWMGAVLDTSLFYVRDVEQLTRVMSTNPSYLHSAVDGVVTQYRDWGIPLGRRFRALKLWFLLSLDGIEAIQARLRRDLANAVWLADAVAGTEGWELVAPVRLQTVCVRHRPAGLAGDELDAHTVAWVRALNDSGGAYLTPSVLDGRWMVRVSIGAEATERIDVEELWRQMRSAAEPPPTP